MLANSAAHGIVLKGLRLLALAGAVAATCATVGAIVVRAQALPIAYWVFDDVSTTTAGNEGVRVNGYGIDPSGRPVISWTDSGAPHPFWSRKDAGVWATTVFNPNKLYPGSGDSAVGHEMALAPDGTPWMAFDGTAGEEFYMWRTDLNADPTGATLSAVIGDLTSYRNCTYGEHTLAFSPAGAPSDLRYHNYCNPFGSRLILNGTVVAGGLGWVNGADYTVAPNGSSHILYSDSGAVRHSDGTGRGTDMFGIHRFSGEVQIEADAGGTLHAVIRGYGSTWDGDMGQLVYLTSTDGGTTWSAPETINASRAAMYPVLALDRNGIPAVAFWLQGEGLYYGSRAGGAWQFSRVFGPPWWDSRSVRLRLAFDSANTPSIAFADWSARRVRIARPMADGGGGGGDVPVDLAVSIVSSQDVAPIGTTLTYTVSVVNQGARDATGIVLDVTLPSNFTYVSASPAPASASGGRLTFNLGGLHSRVGTSASINARASAEGKLPLHGSAAAVEPDANAADNAGDWVVEVRGDQCFAPRDGGMFAWWPAEGNGAEMVRGIGVDLFGGAGYAPGKIGRGFAFDGATGYAKLAARDDNLLFPYANSFSMQAWVRTNKATDLQVIAGKGQAADNWYHNGPGNYFFGVSDGVLVGYLNDTNTSTSSYGKETSVYGTHNVADGQFHHVALVRDMVARELRLYLDGQLEASTTLVGGAEGSIQASELGTGRFSIGMLGYLWWSGRGPAYFFQGEIDDLAWYTRVLGGDEIATLYANVNSVACGAPGPPTVTVPADMTVEATGSTGATVTFEAIALDFDGAPLSPICTPASGSVFAIATTAVSCSATDASDRTGTASFTVTVSDTTPPALTLPAGTTATATDADGALVSFVVAATDLVDGTVAVTCVPASDTTFPIGTTAVSCSATDRTGHESTGSFTITVDVPPPAIINIAEVIHVTDAPALLPSVMLSIAETVYVTDAPAMLPSVMLSIAETVHVTDAATLLPSVMLSIAETVHVTDSATLPTPPTVTVPADTTVEATGAAGATVTFGASAVDFAGAALSPVCTPASGSVFAIATTLVSCSATDTSGRPATASFNVTVRDTTPPVLNLPADMTVGSGPAGAVVTFTASATDLVAGAVDASCIPASGALFSPGTTTVSCSTVDSAGNAASGSFSVVVVPTNQPPVIELVQPVEPFVRREGDTVGVRVVASDPEGSVLSISITGLPPAFPPVLETQGVRLEAFATLSAGSVGTYTPTVTVSDGQLSVSRSFTWIVQPANRAPIARADSIMVPPGQTTAILVLANDEDPDGDPLTITTVSRPTFGHAEVTHGKTIYYTPGPMVGSYEDSFTYTISDGQGGTASAMVTVRVLSSTPAATLKVDVSPAAIQWGNGEPIVYTLTVTNVSTVSLTNAALTNTLPMGLGFVSATPPPSMTSDPQVTFNLATIATGASATVVILGSRPPAPGSYIDTASVTFDNGPPSSATASLSVEPEACFTTTTSEALVARWRGDRDTTDDVSGLPTQPIGTISYADGRVQQAFSLAGPNDRLEVGWKRADQRHIDPRLDLPRFTIGAWVKPGSLSNGSFSPVVSRGGGLGYTYWLGFDSGRPALFTGHSGDVTASVRASAAVAANAWYYLAGSYDGTTARLYLNGSLVAQSAVGLPLAYDAGVGTFDIGYGPKEPPPDDAGFSGLLDEVTVHSRALTDAEVDALANGTTATCFAAASSDLSVSVSASPAVTQTNGVITYTATVTNRTHGYVDDVTLTNDLPEGLTLLDATPAASGVSGLTQSFDLGTLLDGVSKTVTIRAAAPSFDGRFTDVAKVTSSLPDTNHANDSASATVTVEPEGCFVTPTGLVSRWRGENDTKDDVGGRDGEPLGVGYAVGRVGWGFDFPLPPFGGWVRIADSPGLRPSLFTIGAWVRPSDLRAPGWNTAIARGSNGADPQMDSQSFSYFLGFHDGFPVLVTHHGGVGRQVTQSTSPAVADEWYYLAGSFDGATARLYVNGVVAAETMVNAPLHYDPESVLTSIGLAFKGGHQDDFDGLVDEVVLYDRALNDAEALALFDGSPATCVVNDTPVLTNPGDQTNKEGDEVTLDLQASDPGGGSPLQFSAVGLPAGLAIDTATGRIHGAIEAGASKTYAASVTVTDGTLAAQQSFEWTVLARLTLRVGLGGSVTINDEIACDGTTGATTCVAHFPLDTPVTFRATLSAAAETLEWARDGTSFGGDRTLAASMSRSMTWDATFLTSFAVAVSGLQYDDPRFLIHAVPLMSLSCSDSRSLDNGPQCTGRVPVGTSVAVTAENGNGETFAGWSDACSGMGICTMTIDRRGLLATATYRLGSRTLRLDVGRGGLVRINGDAVCDGGSTGTTCTVAIPYGTAVDLSAVAEPGWPQRWRWRDMVSLPPPDDRLVRDQLASLAHMYFDRHIDVRFDAPLAVTFAGLRSPIVEVNGPNFSGYNLPIESDLGLHWDCAPPTEGSQQCVGLWPRAPGMDTADMTPYASFGNVATQIDAFVGWSGACQGTGRCALPLDRPDLAVTMNFAPGAVVRLTVGPGGVATLGAKPCDGGTEGTSCSAAFPMGTSVPLGVATSGALGPVWILPGGQQTVLRNVVFTVPAGTQSLFEISVAFTHANQAPTIASVADQSSLEGDAVSLALDASDPEGDPLSWSASGLPAGLSLSIAGGAATVVGTIASGAGGVYTPHINVTDAALTASTSFTWTVDNTPAGPGSLVTLPGASIAFAGVATPGLTTLTTSTPPPPIPDGFQMGNPPVFFDLTTTATFNSAVVCVGYAPSAFRDPGTLRMLHYELNVWRDVTLSLDQVAHRICGSVTAFSPFVVVEPLNRAPVAVAGPDRVLEATSPAGAMIALDGSASSDPDADPLTYTWIGRFGTATGAAPVVTLPLGSNTITLTVQDGRGGTATATVVVIVRDTIAPTVTIASPTSVTYAFNQTVVASYACADSGSGVASCTGPVTSGSPIDTGSEGAHTFAVTAQDVAGNTTTTTVTYTVMGVEGRMQGGGEIRTPDGREHKFEFQIAERRVGLERGELHYRVKTPKAGKKKERADRFESQSIGSIVFWDNPAFKAGRGPKPTADSAIFSGTGKWNGAAGYTFEARAADQGEPGRWRDAFAITIRDGWGTIVATVGGTLTGGNIQSSRLPGRHEAEETRR